MIKAIIKVEGKYYIGEDPNTAVKDHNGGLTSGFHPNNNREVNKLIFSNDRNEAHEAWGARGIKSVLDRLEKREQMGLLPKGFNLEIKSVNYE
jgi:lauroyl/myristoyl acyltransferase